MIMLKINATEYTLNVEPEMPLLWVLRDIVGLTGTKYSCGIAQCGACNVHVNGETVRSCVTTVGTLKNKDILTIEGLSEGALHPVQKAWIEADVVQCGYCQSGQIMSAAGLLAKNSSPSDDDIDRHMSGNLCRCGTYPRIRKAIKLAASTIAKKA